MDAKVDNQLSTTCCEQPRELRLHGHLVRVSAASIVQVGPADIVCVACFQTRLVTGGISVLDDAERSWVSDLQRQSWRAHDAIARKIEVDAKTLPDPILFTSLGLVVLVSQTALFTNWLNVHAKYGNEGIRSAYRDLFGLSADPAARVIVHTPIARPIYVTNQNYVDHLFERQGGRDGLNDDHVLYSPLTTSTLEAPNEVWLNTPEKAKRPRLHFLRLYYDNFEDKYIYHMVIAYQNGEVRTTYRLGGGLEAFRSHRFGKLLYVAY